MSSRRPDPLLPVRSAVVFLIAFVTCLIAGVLGFLACRSVPAALLVAGGAGSAAVTLSDRALDRH